MAGMGPVPEGDFRELPREPRPQQHKWGYLRQLHRQTGLDLGFLKMQGITGTNLGNTVPTTGIPKGNAQAPESNPSWEEMELRLTGGPQHSRRKDIFMLWLLSVFV